MANITIIDDDEIICDALSRTFKDMGHNVQYALTLHDGLKAISSQESDVVFLDVRLPDGNGLNALPTIQQKSSAPEVIIMTGEGDPDGAELAIKSGAWDYVEKPVSIKQMILPLTRALQYREQKKANDRPVALKREGIVGDSLRLKNCLDLVAQSAAGDVNVLITGETGTGKELFARAIHNNSRRAERTFVTVDCTALPETLVESTLFGHEKGAFTSADRAQEGLIKQANGGTLFLDEIGELPRNIQKKFLRVLQEYRFRPVGGKKEIISKFRLISATNRNLDRMVEQGTFRKDLLYRLRSLTLELPPLRERPEDIQELTLYHIARVCERQGTETKGFSPEFFSALISYHWPGNVRELLNTLDGTLSLAAHEPTLYMKHLPTDIRVQIARMSVGKDRKDNSSEAIVDSPKTLPRLREFRQSLEKQYLKDLVLVTERDMKKAGRISGLSRSHLYELLNRYNILPPE